MNAELNHRQILQEVEELYEAAWKNIKQATADKDAGTAARASSVANEVDTLLTQLEIRCRRWRQTLEVGSDDGVSFKGQRPTGLVFDNRHYPCQTWAGILERLANLLREKYGSDFDQKVLELHGAQGKLLFSNNLKAMPLRNAHQLKGNPDLWVECNFSADAIHQRCKELLAAFDIDRDELEAFEITTTTDNISDLVTFKRKARKKSRLGEAV
jgi:hypothetical protein